MSERLFRAARDFVLVRLPLNLRVFAMFLIFASPAVLVALYFDTLDHFNNAMYHIPSFALLALSAIIFYRFRWYAYYDQVPWAADRDLGATPGILGSSSESQSCCCLSGAFFARAFMSKQHFRKQHALAAEIHRTANQVCARPFAAPP